MEIPSPRAGRILHVLAKLGDRIKIGAPLVEFEEGAHEDAGTVVGSLAIPGEHHRASAGPSAAPRHGSIVKAAPAVRAFAAEHGIDLASIEASGPGGAVTREDVSAAMAERPAAAREALRGVRLSMARNMALAHQSVVPATLFDDADVTRWWTETADVTMRLIRGIAAGCAAEPGLNCWFDGTRLEREPKARIDLGIAIDTAAGLIVPVLRDVGGRDAAALHRSLDTLKSSVRARTVQPAELKGATITLSNFGVIGGRYACLVVVPPQVAIVGAGKVLTAAMPRSRESGAGAWLPLSVTFDHRVVTGAESARFVKAMIEDLERPE